MLGVLANPLLIVLLFARSVFIFDLLTLPVYGGIICFFCPNILVYYYVEGLLSFK